MSSFTSWPFLLATTAFVIKTQNFNKRYKGLEIYSTFLNEPLPAIF